MNLNMNIKINKNINMNINMNMNMMALIQDNFYLEWVLFRIIPILNQIFITRHLNSLQLTQTGPRWSNRNQPHVLGCLLCRHLSPAVGQTFLVLSKCFKSLIFMCLPIPEELEELCSLVSISTVRECYTKILNWPLNCEKKAWTVKKLLSFEVGYAKLSV